MLDKRPGLEDKSQGSDKMLTRALVVGPYLNEKSQSKKSSSAGFAARSTEARMDEAAGLAAAIDLDIVGAMIVMLANVRPATFIGKGKAQEIADLVQAENIDLVIMDCALSPIQQRNLEKAFSAKVIDRTGLILEIFGQRARTSEGALQVELAHLAYQKSRLVRSWTHLERQRGGFGFLGGPGETQIETDRRLIQERMTRIEQDLEKVKRTRGLHRKSRRDVPYPVVALVGYTNAGKSTLFNRMTHSDVFAENMLFATLDPTLRAVSLGAGAKIILSDTVGFISDLPLMLVSAFRATLEEVLEADLILHVRDIAHEDADAQRTDVETILRDLGVDPDDHRRILEVWNKADLLDEAARDAARNAAKRRAGRDGAEPVIVSALTGQGLDELRAQIETRLAMDRLTFEIELQPENGEGLHWLYENAEVLRRSAGADGTLHMKVRVGPERAESIRRRFIPMADGSAQVEAGSPS
ncbi:GTP-binding proten HflX [Methylocella silvestris BL2]|uniref:GTPase HflX n=1 Tax=Methylocella silvestris (strain DSM 15510 / CIP 108128 / LMG 27833 / NCIMB 13906 / BL2) TaxID=395965 RepID=B8ELB9_METSB|nr:GTPase HflX [Methylocella silvestris]ACK49508.1 GTP-binding proten HflX [Methylocella silvestris BL2]